MWSCAKIIFAAFILLSYCPANAFNIKRPSAREILFGYGYGEQLKNRGEYAYYSLALNASYPFSRGGAWENFCFQIEPFVSFVVSPQHNGELGCAFFISYLFPWDSPVKPFVRAGSGIILITQETEEQSTLFNFASQLGCGVSYRFSDKSISLEYRYRHVSNCNIDKPNAGIDNFIWLLGIGGVF